MITIILGIILAFLTLHILYSLTSYQSLVNNKVYSNYSIEKTNATSPPETAVEHIYMDAVTGELYICYDTLWILVTNPKTKKNGLAYIGEL